VSYNNIQTKGNLYQFKMLSTITVYSTYEDESGKKKTQFFDPKDPAFSILIEKICSKNMKHIMEMCRRLGHFLSNRSKFIQELKWSPATGILLSTLEGT